MTLFDSHRTTASQQLRAAVVLLSCAFPLVTADFFNAR